MANLNPMTSPNKKYIVFDGNRTPSDTNLGDEQMGSANATEIWFSFTQDNSDLADCSVVANCERNDGETSMYLLTKQTVDTINYYVLPISQWMCAKKGNVNINISVYRSANPADVTVDEGVITVTATSPLIIISEVFVLRVNKSPTLAVTSQAFDPTDWQNMLLLMATKADLDDIVVICSALPNDFNTQVTVLGVTTYKYQGRYLFVSSDGLVYEIYYCATNTPVVIEAKVSKDKITTLNSYFTTGVLKVANGGTGNSSVDSSPVENSTKMLPSGKIYDALALKVDKTQTVNGHALSGDVSVTKADLVIENVDNTSDADKPVSTAQATAIGLKVAKTFTIGGIALDANISATALTAIINEATTSLKGLMSAHDKEALDALHALMVTSDGDSIVNTINEILAIFAQYPEGVDLVTALAAKVASDDTTFTDGVVIVQNGATLKKIKQSAIPSAKLVTTDDTSATDATIVVQDSTTGKKYKKSTIVSTKLVTTDDTSSTDATIVVQDSTTGKKYKKSATLISDLAPQSTTYTKTEDDALLLAKADKLYATNLIANGNFANGTTGWSSSFASLSVSNNNLLCTGTGEQAYSAAFTSVLNFNKYGDVLFAKGKYKINNSSATSVTISLSYWQDGAWIASGSNDYETYSNIVENVLYDFSFLRTVRSENDYNKIVISIYFNYSSAEIASGKETQISYIEMIDVSELFVFVPTAHEMDNKLSYFPNNYIDGTQVLVDTKTLDFYLSKKSDNPLYSKTVLWDGDSICIGAFGKGYPITIAIANNMVSTNYGVVGATVAYVSGQHCISRNIASMSSTADYVIWDGGVNDISLSVALGSITTGFTDEWDDTTFIGALESMFSDAYAKWATAKFGFIIVHKIYAMDNAFETAWIPAIISVCNKWGIHVIDLSKTSAPINFVTALKTAYTNNADGWHPNEAGYNAWYVPQITAQMKLW